jgi:hypothetical protein
VRPYVATRTQPPEARAEVDRFGELPQLLIEIDRERAARYGLNVGDIQDVIEAALAEPTTPGTPAPGCVPAPTKYRFGIWSSRL